MSHDAIAAELGRAGADGAELGRPGSHPRRTGYDRGWTDRGPTGKSGGESAGIRTPGSGASPALSSSIAHPARPRPSPRFNSSHREQSVTAGALPPSSSTKPASSARYTPTQRCPSQQRPPSQQSSASREITPAAAVLPAATGTTQRAAGRVEFVARRRTRRTGRHGAAWGGQADILRGKQPLFFVAGNNTGVTAATKTANKPHYNSFLPDHLAKSAVTQRVDSRGPWGRQGGGGGASVM